MKKATKEDLERLVSIGRKTYRQAFSLQNSSEVMMAYLQKAFSEDAVRRWFDQPTVLVYLAIRKSDENVIGYLKLNLPPNQTDFNMENSLEIERIYLLANEKRKGYGQQMISFAESVARTCGAGLIWLGVWAENTKGILFYQQMGYKITGQHPFVMGHEIQTDYVMKKTLEGRV
jgi:ribosomal protein S18 acetylase RimI-like enzyme